jgi:hypothetical protein
MIANQPARARSILWVLALAPALLAGCSRERVEESGDVAAESVSEADVTAPAGLPANPVTAQESAASTVPSVGPAAAPGVAFAYRFDFRLPDERIGEVQDLHAAACEALGVARCRITGMRHAIADAHEATGMLSFNLEPGLARRFGQQAIASVEAADGELAESEITGNDVATPIGESQERSASFAAELARLERRLAAPGLAAGERESISLQITTLRARMASEARSRAAGEQKLAMTPMQFTYSGVGGVGNSHAFSRAFAVSAASLTTMLAVLLTGMGVALPWLIPIALGVFAWRRWVRPRLSRHAVATPMTLPTAADSPLV